VSAESSPRLPPLPLEKWGDTEWEALRFGFGDAIVERYQSAEGTEPETVLATMMHNPRVAGPWLAYSNVLLRNPTLEPRYRELMVLRVAWRTRAEYEWVQHVRLRDRYGITLDDVDAITRGPDAPEWTPLERDLVAATDQLLDRYQIDRGTWDRLAEHFDPGQLVELTFVVGTYLCLALAFNSWGLQLDEHLDRSAGPAFPQPEE
jgi:4-carboxymuconolactone decarboxylase